MDTNASMDLGGHDDDARHAHICTHAYITHTYTRAHTYIYIHTDTSTVIGRTCVCKRNVSVAVARSLACVRARAGDAAATSAPTATPKSL
jgi:hypothetical protein